ncbi:MAG: hypothetical protein A2136_09255 [Chloroflexi bacterium RBG_16_54_11]|nr:MAG: hypothetical protein A2136_09255 [Chloroflexi bacterium RBG_16_54_11]
MTNFAHPLPRHQANRYTREQFSEILAKKPLGWGAYKIDDWIPGKFIRLSRNPYYFRAVEELPHFEKLVFRFFGGDEAATLKALQSKDCDLVDTEQGLKHLTLERLLDSDKRGWIKGIYSTSTSWEHLDFNIRPAESILNTGAFAGWDLDGDGQGPFGDIRLRQAIAMCLDRQKVVDDLFYGLSPVPNTYLPPDHPLYNPQAVAWPYDPSSAAALLDQIGWIDTDNDPATPRLASSVTGVPDGTPLVMNYETSQRAPRQQVFDILSKSLATCGIQINLQTYSAVDFFKFGKDGKVYGRMFDLVEFAWLTNTIPPCDLVMGDELSSAENDWSGLNVVGFLSPSYDAACNSQFQSLPGEAAYTQAALDAQQIFAEELPVVPLFLHLKYASAYHNLCGYVLNPTSSDFWAIESFSYNDACK